MCFFSNERMLMRWSLVYLIILAGTKCPLRSMRPSLDWPRSSWRRSRRPEWPNNPLRIFFVSGRALGVCAFHMALAVPPMPTLASDDTKLPVDNEDMEPLRDLFIVVCSVWHVKSPAELVLPLPKLEPANTKLSPTLFDDSFPLKAIMLEEVSGLNCF